MFDRILTDRGALNSYSTPTLSTTFRRLGNVADHVACSVLSVFQAPRRRIGHDPLSRTTGPVARRYVPVPIDRLKLSGDLAGAIVRQRRLSAPFCIEEGKRLGIVIPYRNRPKQLTKLLERLEIVLPAAGIDYRVIVAEQSDKGLFNRGKMKNVGATLLADWSDYLCFHDVDNLPLSADYRCPNQPLRLVKNYSKTHRDDNPIRGYFFGAVVSIRRDQFEAVNGYDNRYWGWGQEDEDLFLRCLLAGLVPHEDTAGLYEELDNPSEELAERAFLVRRRNRYLMKAGMTSKRIGRLGLSDLDYSVVAKSGQRRILHAIVDI